MARHARGQAEGEPQVKAHPAIQEAAGASFLLLESVGAAWLSGHPELVHPIFGQIITPLGWMWISGITAALSLDLLARLGRRSWVDIRNRLRPREVLR